MRELRHNTFTRNLFSILPITLLYISVLNEFDANYLNIQYLSFNFSYILIFYWSLKRIKYFSYLAIFFAGIINDAVSGLPVGLSSLIYILICIAAAYLRSITLRPNIINDWIYFLFTVSIVNTIYYLIISYVFLTEINYKFLLTNNFSTFLLYFFCQFIFGTYYLYFIGRNDV